MDWYRKLKIQKDMLEGNINRMFITDDMDEMDVMYETAVQRLNAIYEGNKKRLEEVMEHE